MLDPTPARRASGREPQTAAPPSLPRTPRRRRSSPSTLLQAAAVLVVGVLPGPLPGLQPALASAQDAPFALSARSVAERAAEVAPRVRISQDASDTAASQTDWTLATLVAPRLDLQGSYTRLSELEQPPFEFAGMALESPFPVLLDNVLFRASLTVPVSAYFLSVAPAYEAARAAARVAETTVEVERQTAALRAQEAFFGYVQAQAAEEVVGEAIALLDAQLEVTEALAEAGEVTPADLSRVRAQRAEVLAQQAGARAAVVATERHLRTVLQLPEGRPLVVSADLFEAPQAPSAASAIESEALAHRPELRVLRELARSHRERARAAEGGRYPALLLSANLDYANPNQRLIPPTERFVGTWAVTVAMRWSPHDAVEAQMQADRAYLDERRAANDLEMLEQQITIQATQLTAQLNAARQSAEAADVAVRSAREALETRRELLQAGEATTTELLDAELSLRRANAARLNSYATAHLAEARIRHLTGAALAGR